MGLHSLMASEEHRSRKVSEGLCNQMAIGELCSRKASKEHGSLMVFGEHHSLMAFREHHNRKVSRGHCSQMAAGEHHNRKASEEHHILMVS